MPFSELENLQSKIRHEAQTWFKQSGMSSFESINVHDALISLSHDDRKNHPLGQAAEKVYQSVIPEIKIPPSAEWKWSKSEKLAVVMEINRAADKAFYRIACVLGQNPQDVDLRWNSPSLSRGKITRLLIDQNIVTKSMGESVNSFGDVRDMERRVIPYIVEIPFGVTVYDSYDLNRGENYPLTIEAQAFLVNDGVKELAEWCYHLAMKADGRSQHMDRQLVCCETVAAMLCFALKREDISVNMIQELVDAGVVTNKKLWDTDIYNRYLAPEVTLKEISNAESYLKQFCGPDTLFYTLKESLSRKEIFNHLMGNRFDTLDAWRFGMNRFAAVTGEHLSFAEARAMNPSRSFDLKHTQAYSDHIDKTFHSGDFSRITYEVIRGHLNSDKERDFSIHIYSHLLNIERIYDAIACAGLDNPALQAVQMMPDGIFFEGSCQPSRSNNSTRQATVLAEQLVNCLKDLAAKEILPGDVVQIINSEDTDATEVGLRAGDKHLVTDLKNTNCVSYKLKGMVGFVDGEFLKLKKKYVPNLDASKQIDR